MIWSTPIMAQSSNCMACSGYELRTCLLSDSVLIAAQTRQLYVFDPLALSSIVVKDQYVYEESPEFLA